MKNKSLIVLFAVFIIGLATFSHAREVQGIGHRIRDAHVSIDRGIRSGSLTREEARRLKHQLDNIRDDEARMKEDGRLSHRERERLSRELRRLEVQISRLRQNDNRRGDDRRR